MLLKHNKRREWKGMNIQWYKHHNNKNVIKGLQQIQNKRTKQQQQK